MDVHVDETKVSHSKKCNNLHKASLVLSVLAILLTIALFLRMEISTQMLEVKVTLEIQEIKETLKSVKDARFPNRVNDHLDLKRNLEISEMKFEDRGMYTCTAENLLGRVELSVNITVRGM